MKKLIVLLLTAIATIVASGSLMSCKDRQHADVKDSAVEIAQMNAYMNPTFDNVGDFVDYAIDRASSATFVAIVSKLDRVTITTITSTALKNNGNKVDWRSWLAEYNLHRDIYTEMDRVSREQKVANTTVRTAPSDTVEYSSLQTTNK